MKISNSEVKNYMTMKFNFGGVRFYENMLNPVEWELSVNVVGVDVEGDTKNAIRELGSLAYQKIYFWLDSNLTNVVVCDVNEEMGFNVCNVVDNMMMYCPGEPTDDLIIQLLHAKLTSLAGKNLFIGEMTLSSTDTSASYTFCGPDKYQGQVLPKKTADYVSYEALHKIPWWARDDGYCFEFLRLDPDDTTPLEIMFKDIEDPMKRFEKSLIDGYDEVYQTETKPAEIIQVERWHPKTV